MARIMKCIRDLSIEFRKSLSKIPGLNRSLLVIAMLLIPSPANAFECPKHIALALGAINDFKELLVNMKGKMPTRDLRFLHRELDDAAMFVASAKHSHGEALGYQDHVRAITRTYRARGIVKAASLLHDAFMKELELEKKHRTSRR